MKFGIRWYTGVGEHDYKETQASEFRSMTELLESLVAVTKTFASEKHLLDALVSGPQDTIYWLTDDFGLSFYRPELT